MARDTEHDDRGHKKVGILSLPYSRRIFGILFVVVVGALSLRAALVPEGFGKYGHYRGDAPAEAADREPVHQGKMVCARCHVSEFNKHEKDVHVSVECEDCHGEGKEHVAAREANAPADQGTVFRELEQANCLACHRRLIARPKLFPTIEVASHFALVGVSKPDTPCQSCHNPHEPLFLDRTGSEARIHPLIHPCSDCHHEADIEKKALPEGHVVTFRCKDCHADIVADFKQKPHGELDCRVCHLFHKESDFSGRIYKNGNPRFCLMCHLETDFKSGKKIKLITSFEGHREEMGGEGNERCVDCHVEDYIHSIKDRKKSVVVPAEPPQPAAPPQQPQQ